jgi:hypothetical protein
MTIEATATDASTEPVFRGTPDEWWEAAEEITQSHAAERDFGDWYITKVRNFAGAAPAFRIATPSKPPNEVRRSNLAKMYPVDEISDTVRRLIHVETPVAAWMTSEYVLADLKEGSAERGPWRRMNSGRWQRITDARISVNDHTMSELNPLPATFTSA